MVKVLSRKVIVVKSPDPKIFEQAIFIVKDDYLLTRGIDQKELMRQAGEAASGYVDRAYKQQRSRISKLLAFGALLLVVAGLIAALGYYSLM